MPASATDWQPTLTLAGVTIAAALSDAGAAEVVAIESLTLTYGRDSIMSGTDGDTLTFALLIRSGWWAQRSGTLGGKLVTLKLAPPAGHLTPDSLDMIWADAMFTGRVVPESVQLSPVDRDGDLWRLEVAAIDLRAWSGSLIVAQPAWPAELLSLRLARLDTFTRANAGYGISGYVGGLNATGAGADPIVNASPVDRRSVLDVVDDLAAGVGGCWLWTQQVQGSTIPVLALTALAEDGATTPLLRWNGGVAAAATVQRVVLPGRYLTAEDATATQAVGAVNEVRVNYTNATPADVTSVASDLSSQAAVGLRSLEIAGVVQVAGAAAEIAARVLRIGQRLARYRHPAITWSAAPPEARPDVTANALDAAARAAMVLAPHLMTTYPAQIFVAGSVYNRMPGELLVSTWPTWQAIGGELTYTDGRLTATLTLAPRYVSTLPTELTWALLTATTTWAQLRAGGMVQRSVVWADLPALAA